MIYITDDNWNNGEILTGSGILVVKASASWCGPCKVYKPIFEEFAEKNTDPEVCVKLRMSVSNTDIKEWFNSTTGQGTCRVNCISLCTAIPYLETGTEGPLYFKDIRPITRYNFKWRCW